MSLARELHLGSRLPGVAPKEKRCLNEVQVADRRIELRTPVPPLEALSRALEEPGRVGEKKGRDESAETDEPWDAQSHPIRGAPRILLNIDPRTWRTGVEAERSVRNRE